MTNVKSYTDKQLLARVKSISKFTHIPVGFWLLFVRSEEDAFNKFDDKAYLFKGEQFISVTSCTTNKGPNGTAVIRSDQWLYDGFIFGLHNGKMEALRQNKPFWFFRDTNKDEKTDEAGKEFCENIQVQFHGATYIKGADTEREEIGPWSEGCIVANKNKEYEAIISTVKPQKIVSGVLIKEF